MFFVVGVLTACNTVSVEDVASVTITPKVANVSTPTPVLSARIDLAEDLYAREVQAGVFVITHAFPWPGNSMLVEMADGTLVLVDTPYTPEATQTVLEWAEKQLGKRDIVAINTGYHYDNLGGNVYLLEQGIPIYGSDLTGQLLAERGDALRAMTLDWLKAPKDKAYYDAHQTLPYVAPDHPFPLDEGLQLTFGDETVEVYYPGLSHTPDNVVVYFPGRKLLFGGCMLIGGDSVGNTADADMKAWPESVRNLARFDVDVVIPGHGERLDPQLIEHTVELISRQ
ncbi:MAG TPA: MBL fold metallo-hydrolase [Anaerolineae bacterium]|nr:MBL fold metallo-hydrolase [Anaerolineae bacterium]